MDGVNAGQAGVDGNSAELTGVAGSPGDGNAEEDKGQEAKRRVPLLEQPLIIKGQRRCLSVTMFTRHNYALTCRARRRRR